VVVADPNAGQVADPNQAQAEEAQAAQAQDAQAQVDQAQQAQDQAQAQAQDQSDQIVAFAPGIELPPGSAPNDGQPVEVQPPSDDAAASAEDDTQVAVVLSTDDSSLTRDPIIIDPAKVAALQSVLDALDRARARTAEAPVPGPQPLVGPGGAIDTALSRVASAVAPPVSSTTSPTRRPTAVPTPSGARTNVAPVPRNTNTVPPALQTLRLRVGQPQAADKPTSETTALRVRVAPEQPRLIALDTSRGVSTDVLSLGLLAGAVAGLGLFGRAAKEGRRRFSLGPRFRLFPRFRLGPRRA
jgi:hypothetical protein